MLEVASHSAPGEESSYAGFLVPLCHLARLLDDKRKGLGILDRKA